VYFINSDTFDRANKFPLDTNPAPVREYPGYGKVLAMLVVVIFPLE
jgi:hypothetical protein